MALITDTGPLLASLDEADADHRACLHLFEATRESIVIPAPVLVELDYWLRRRVRRGGIAALLRDADRGAFQIEVLEPEDYRRVAEILERYADSGIDFVDAAVLAVAERLKEPKIATLDRRHFGLMRPRHIPALELLPELQ